MAEATRPSGVRSLFRGYAIWLPVVIAAVSILGSVVSWRAAVTSSGSADRQASAHRLELQHAQRVGEIDGWIDHDRTVFDRYAETVAQANRYLVESRRASATPAAEIASYLAESHQAQARVLESFFLAGLPDSPSNGRTSYQEAYFRDLWTNTDVDLGALALARDAAREQADSARDKTTWLVGVVAILVLSLFFLTIARFTDAALRVALAATGVVVALVGLSTFVAVELFA